MQIKLMRHDSLFVFLLVGLLISACSDNFTPVSQIEESEEAKNPSGINITWVEKYMTFEQTEAGELHQTDNIFLAEVAYTDAKAVDTHTAEVFVDGVTEPLAAYDSGDLLSLSQATTAGIYVSIPEFLSMLYKKGVAIGLGDEEVVALIKLLRR
tara:strand:- start:1844 stop:2305 length:462 start_codon:yes stop_codon:yes gene_type:complete